MAAQRQISDNVFSFVGRKACSQTVRGTTDTSIGSAYELTISARINESTTTN